MGVPEGYLNLGSLSMEADHGPLLNKAKKEIKGTNRQHRRTHMQDRLKVSQVISDLGLNEAVIGLYMASSSLEDEAEIIKSVKSKLLSLLSDQLGISMAIDGVSSPSYPRKVDTSFQPNEGLI